MANSEILPGKPITASKLNDVTTGTTAPSQPYQIGALWGSSTGLFVFTSTTAFEYLGNFIRPNPRFMVTTNISLSYNSSQDWCVSSLVTAVPILNSDWFGGTFSVTMNGVSTSYGGRFRVHSQNVSTVPLATTDFPVVYTTYPLRHIFVEWAVSPVVANSYRVGYIAMATANESEPTSSPVSIGIFVTKTSVTSVSNSIVFVSPPASTYNSMPATVQLWVG